MIASVTASRIFLLIAALGSTTLTTSASASNNNILGANSLAVTAGGTRNLQFSPSDFSIPDPTSLCNGSSGGDDDSSSSREQQQPICTILNCIDVRTGSFACHCSAVVEAVKLLGAARTSVPGISDDFLNEALSCCPSETSSADFSMCMLGCDDAPEDPACDLLECTDPFTGKFTCHCDVITTALGLIPGGGEAAAALGITDEMVEVAVGCCPQGTVLDAFQNCYDAIQPGLFLPAVDGGGAAAAGADKPAEEEKSQCLVGDIMYLEGDSIGHIGMECIDSASYDGTASTCGPNGQIIDTEKQFTCPESAPFCVQCGQRGWGAALCLSSETTDRDCGEQSSSTGPPATYDGVDTGFDGAADEPITDPNDATDVQNTLVDDTGTEIALPKESDEGATMPEEYDEGATTSSGAVGSQSDPSSQEEGADSTDAGNGAEDAQSIPSDQEEGADSDGAAATQNIPSDEEEADENDPTSASAGMGHQFMATMAVSVLALVPALYI